MGVRESIDWYSNASIFRRSKICWVRCVIYLCIRCDWCISSKPLNWTSKLIWLVLGIEFLLEWPIFISNYFFVSVSLICIVRLHWQITLVIYLHIFKCDLICMDFETHTTIQRFFSRFHSNGTHAFLRQQFNASNNLRFMFRCLMRFFRRFHNARALWNLLMAYVADGPLLFGWM